MRMVKIKTCLLTLVSVLLVIPSLAFAGGKTDVPLDTILEGISWGASKAEVLEGLESIINQQRDTELQGIVDIGKQDQIRKRFRDRFSTIKDSYRDLAAGERSGLRVSIVADEFVEGNNEAVLVVREEIATKYYFFYNDQLYKIAVAYNPAYIDNMHFDAFVEAATDKYGTPLKEDTDEEGFFTASYWLDHNGNQLRISDHSNNYDSFLMVFSSESISQEVEPVHTASIEKRYAAPEVSSDIGDLVGDDEEGELSSAASAILQEEVDVDLMAGLPEEERLAMEEEKKKQEEAEEKKKKKKKRDKKKRDKKKRDKKDKKDEKNGTGIIIY